MQSCLRRENFSGDDPDVGREAEVEEDEVEDEDEQRKPTDHFGIAGTEAKDIKLELLDRSLVLCFKICE